MAIPRDFIDELVSRTDIVDVVSDYVTFTKHSGSNMFALCPFHSEKTPSFSVSPSRQTYKCFGCGKGGGVINFIMDIEGVQYRDAIEILAKRAGLEVPDDGVSSETRSKRTRLLELNRAAAKFFYSNLKKPECAAAIDYIRRRGISPKMVTRFGLGAAPNEWHALANEMKNEGYTEMELLDAGLVKPAKNGGVYDTFRNRLIFPVIDVRGSVLGFSGRILDDGEPKYLNSPDTPVFSKSRNLFALNLAKKTKRDMLILVEGNIDVVSLHQAGIDCAVASLGTALTNEQARLIKNTKDNVVIAYDSDAAGTKASKRAIPMLEQTGLRVKVLQIPNAKDPDEFIKSNGAQAFEKLLDKSENRLDYQIEAICAKYDLTTNDGRNGAAREATEFLSSVPNNIERDIFSRKLAEIMGVSEKSVLAEVERTINRKKAAGKKKREREIMRVDTNLQPKSRAVRYSNIRSAEAEKGVISLLVKDPELINAVNMTKEDFSSDFLGNIFEEIKSRLESGAGLSAQLLTAGLTSDEAEELIDILSQPVSDKNAEKALENYINVIKLEKLRSRAGNDDEAKLAYMEHLKLRKGMGG